jgi:branched-chain amino acid transport system substrate-binding protein
MRKKAILVLMVAVVSMIGGLASCRGAEPVTSYKVGAILAQTGNYAGLGLQALEGIQVVVDEINDGGGINGIPVELVVYDDKSEATEAALVAKKLIEVDKVHVLLTCTTTSLSMSIVPVGNEAETPTVILSGTSLFDDQLGGWVFRPAGGETDYIVTTLDYVAQNMDVTKYATLIENSGYGQGGKVFLPQVSPSYNMIIVEEQYFDPGATDVAPQLTNIKNSEAQAIYIWGSSPTAAMAIKQAREMDISLPIIATPPQLDPRLLESFGQYYEMEPPVISVTAKMDVWQQLPDSDPDKAILREFGELYTERYGHPVAMWGVLGGQLTQFIEDGLKRANADPANLEEARSKIRDAFETTTDLDLLVATYSMSPEDHFGVILGKTKMVMVAFKDGQLVYLP